MIPLPDIDAIAPAGADERCGPPAFTLAPSPAAAPPSHAPRHVGGVLFAEDFDRPPPEPPPAEPEVIAPTFSLDEYEAARTEAYEAGRAAERDAAAAAAAAAEREGVGAIARALKATATTADAIAEESAEALARLLLDTLAALFPALCERFGPAEAEALLRQILPVLHVEPQAVIRIPPALAGRIEAVIADADPALLSRLVLQPDPALAPGDLRVTWRGGEARRDIRTLWARIGEVLHQSGWPLPRSTTPATPKRELIDAE